VAGTDVIWLDNSETEARALTKNAQPTTLWRCIVDGGRQMQRLAFLMSALNVAAIPLYAALCAVFRPGDIMHPSRTDDLFHWVCGVATAIVASVAWFRNKVIGVVVQLAICLPLAWAMLSGGYRDRTKFSIGLRDVASIWSAIVVVAAVGLLLSLSLVFGVRFARKKKP